MKLSVIIACLNGERTLAAQLDALAQQEWNAPWELIVADNGSTDGSLSILGQYKARFAHFRIVDASARRGQPYALNVGAQAATGDALVFVDVDDEVAPGWVAAIGNALAEYDFVASRFEVEKLNAPWIRESRGHAQHSGVQQYYPVYLPFAGSCGLGVKRRFHEVVGGFDESMPVVFDTDYCFRVQLAGASLHFVPDAVIHIRHRATLRGAFRQARTWAQYNVLLYKKYLPLGMPKLTWKDNLHVWVRFVRLLPKMRTRSGRARCVRQFAWRLGRLQGSLKYGVLAL
ncbi:MAG: glycosyltransferase family 2 protein [Candidatus Binatia bacterium]